MGVGKIMSKRHLFYIAKSKNFIKSIKIFGVTYNQWKIKPCSTCWNYKRYFCEFMFALGETAKCYNWYKKQKGFEKT